MAEKMFSRVPTVSTTVVRDGKRVDVVANKSFKFTHQEINDLTRIMPSSLRKPVNEDPEPTDETAHDNNAGPTANDTPKTDTPKTKRRAAAQADSASKEANKSETAPKSTDAAPKAGESDADDDGDTDEDEDI